MYKKHEIVLLGTRLKKKKSIVTWIQDLAVFKILIIISIAILDTFFEKFNWANCKDFQIKIATAHKIMNLLSKNLALMYSADARGQRVGVKNFLKQIEL